MDLSELKPVLPFCAAFHIAILFVYIYVPLAEFAKGRRQLDWLDFPAIGLYAGQSFMLAGFLWWKRRNWRVPAGYLMLIVLAALTRYLHSRYIFDEYVKSEADKVLVILVYHPLCSAVLLNGTKYITYKLINLTPQYAPDSPRWYTIYAGLHLALQVTGR